MGTTETTDTPRAPQTALSPEEMRGLAHRLRARAQSVLLRRQPEQHRDLVTAANLIEQLASLTAEVLAAGAVMDGLSHLLQIGGGA